MRTNRKGRSSGALHVRLDWQVFYSGAFRSLSTTARAMLFEFVGLHMGDNNGDLWLGQRDAGALVGTDKKTAATAIRELIDHGLIVPSRPGSFSTKARHATCYRLTFLASGGRPASGEWRDFQPERLKVGKQRAIARLAAVHEAAPFQGKRRAFCNKLQTQFLPPSGGEIGPEPTISHCTSGGEIPPDEVKNAEITTEASGGKIGSHLIYHPPSSDRAAPSVCARARSAARQWRDEQGPGAQKKLAALSGLTESKLSRFLNDNHGRRGLTNDELRRLNQAIRPPKNSAAPRSTKSASKP